MRTKLGNSASVGGPSRSGLSDLRQWGGHLLREEGIPAAQLSVTIRLTFYTKVTCGTKLQ